jgi:flagellar motor switch protein FliN/FliY
MAKASATAEKTQENQNSKDSSAEGGQAAQTNSKKQVSAQRLEFTEAVGTQAGGTGGKFDIILDINVPVTAAIGQAQIPVRRLLQIGPGSVLKLDKPIDAPADLYLKEAKFATGDVVVVDGQFAVRIKQIIGAGSSDTVENDRKAEDG